jgi:hypothetical protein
MAVALGGGIQLLLSAMTAHPNDPRLQQLACFALANLCSNSGTCM